MVDLIFKIDLEHQLQEVRCLGSAKEWFDAEAWSESIGQKIDYILGTSIHPLGGILEIQSRFLKYQWIDEPLGATLVLSRDGILLDLYEQTIQQVVEGIQIYDRNGYFLHGNPASETLERYKNKDFKGKHVMDLYDLKEEFSTVLTVLRTQKPVLNRCDNFKTTTGKTLTTINSGYPLKIGAQLYGACVFESDLSGLKRIKSRTFNLEAYVESQHPTHQELLYTFEDIVHESESMKEAIHFAKKVSLTDSSILIVGATGTGKELMAQSIHSFSPRRHKPFIDVNCSAVPTNLFESMFFGTEKGAFTGSIAKQGFFEMAEGGTLFLDEVNSITPDMQAKLLRVLQEKRFQRIGGNKYIRSDVRIITAANEDFFELMQQQKVRKDFYYRISTIKIDIPTLQERKEDIPALAKYFLDEFCNHYHRSSMTLSERALDEFLQYEWPGNVREFRHTIEYAFTRAPEDALVLEFEHLPDYLQSTKRVSHKAPNHFSMAPAALSIDGNFDERMETFERKLIENALTLHERNVSKSAKSLGMSRQNLQYRMRKFGILTE
jgi:arginine utilization regulatory protein